MAENKKKHLLHIPEKNYYITIENGKRLIMEGVEKIVFCDPEKMILQSKFRLEIEGCALQLEELGNDNMAVSGTIRALYFSEGKR